MPQCFELAPHQQFQESDPKFSNPGNDLALQELTRFSQFSPEETFTSAEEKDFPLRLFLMTKPFI